MSGPLELEGRAVASSACQYGCREPKPGSVKEQDELLNQSRLSSPKVYLLLRGEYIVSYFAVLSFIICTFLCS